MDAGCCVVQDKTQHSRLKNKIIDLFLLNFSRFIFVYFVANVGVCARIVFYCLYISSIGAYININLRCISTFYCEGIAIINLNITFNLLTASLHQIHANIQAEPTVSMQ